MTQLLKHLDVILRTYKTDTQVLVRDDTRIRPGRLLAISIILGAIYGLCMGAYAVFTRTPPCYAQMFVSATKVPALFILTLVVTLPSLYVFGALQGIKLGCKETLRLIMIPVAVNLTVLASLGPITGFFTLCTTSYPFIKLLNVGFFALSGIIGLKVLLSMMERLDEADDGPSAALPESPGGSAESHETVTPKLCPPLPQPKTPIRRPSRSVADRTFRVWLLLYAVVGAQMGWVLRPFIGDPDMPFEFFGARDANFFIDVLRPFIGSPNAAVAFFRFDAWGNAYVVLLQLVVKVMRGS